jgi:DNA-binding response OmpR family regulator
MSHERPPVLLIVDDEERILSSLRRALRKEGYEIPDHKMPGLGGLELLERAAAIRPSCALLLITGWPEEVDPGRVRELGIRAVIPKPWDDADLKATLRKVLGG